MVERRKEDRWIDWQGEASRGGTIADHRDSVADNLELLLFTLGHKPAVKVEDQGPEGVEELRTLAQKGGFHFEAIARDSGPTPEERDMDSGGGERLSQVFISREEPAIALLVEMERRERSSGNQRREAIVRSGELLGYPPCCVRFFAGLKRQDDEAVLEAYRKNPGLALHASPIFNIFPPLASPVTWYPCSFHCAASMARAGTMAADMQMLGKGLTASLDHLAGITLVFERFLFVHLHGACRSEGWVKYGSVSDALSWTRDPLFVESERLKVFRQNVTQHLAAARCLRVHGDAIELQLECGCVQIGVLQSESLQFTFAEH
jgi:hypothetical protein